MDFDKAIEHLQNELRTIHTNRATPALVEGIEVDAYGAKMKLQELASISTPEAQLMVIQPWDQTQMKAIEDALRNSTKLQANPVVDGDIIRISFPPLTEEKRKELVKIVGEKVEDARISVRKVREELLKDYKEQQKAGDLSEDDYFSKEKEVQAQVDDCNTKIKDIAAAKEDELMTI